MSWKALRRDQPYAVLSGPSFADEIMKKQPTAVESVAPVSSSPLLPSYHKCYHHRLLLILIPSPPFKPHHHHHQVVASRALYHAVMIQRALSSESFRIYTSQDVIGVQLGGGRWEVGGGWWWWWE